MKFPTAELLWQMHLLERELKKIGHGVIEEGKFVQNRAARAREIMSIDKNLDNIIGTAQTFSPEKVVQILLENFKRNEIVEIIGQQFIRTLYALDAGHNDNLHWAHILEVFLKSKA